jgi:hypothetical protein
MPRISQFYGVIIYMYFNDHLPAHFHAEYGSCEAVYAIETLEVLRGNLPRRAHIMVIEWALARRSSYGTTGKRRANNCPWRRLNHWINWRSHNEKVESFSTSEPR